MNNFRHHSNLLRSFKYSIIAALSLVFLAGCGNKDKSGDSPIAKGGVINLQNWNTFNKPYVPLEGDWEFQSLDPHNTNTITSIRVPGTWNQKMGGNGHGAGIYKLSIVLPHDQFIQENQLAIQLNDISTAYKLTVNGEVLHTKGKVGFSREEMVPSYKRNMILIPNPRQLSEIDIELFVTNYYHPKGGLRSSPYIGSWQSLVQKDRDQLIVMWILVGSTFVMSIYHMVVFSLRSVDKSILWFSILSFQVGCRALFDKSVFVYSLFPDSYWTIIHKIDVITFAVTLPLFSLFLCSVFRRDFNRYMLRLFIAVGLLYISVIMIFPSDIYIRALSYFEIFVLFSIIYFVYIIGITLKRKREGSILFLIGSTILFLTTIHDILNQMRILYTGYYTNWGFLGFLFSQTTLLARRFTNAYITMEDLKSNLESKVHERTKELNHAKKKAEDANSIKDKFLSLVSHDLRSPIATVIGLLNIVIDDYKALSEEEKLDFLEKARSSSNHSLSLISQLLNMNRLQSGTIEIIPSEFDVYAELDEITNKLFLPASQKYIRVINRIPKGMILVSDRTLIGEIFFNLLSNAIKFSRLGSEIIVDGKYGSESYEFEILDHGVGIDPAILPNIFRSELKTTTRGTQGEEGTGLGLPLVYEIIQALNGEISVESSQDWGTRFQFRIPISNS